MFLNHNQKKKDGPIQNLYEYANVYTNVILVFMTEDLTGWNKTK